MRLIVVNRCFGGFGLSAAALDYMKIPYTVSQYGLLDYESDIKRDDPRLIACVLALGPVANGPHANLQVVEVPSDLTHWSIDDYDGSESVVASASPIFTF